jgi:hypothetical protein
MHRPVKKYELFDDIMEGDVIRWNGRMRKVRRVMRGPDDAVQNMCFAILRRSWTDRAYTIYFRSDIRTCFGGIVATNQPLCSSNKMECLVQREIETRGDTRLVTAGEMAGAIL